MNLRSNETVISEDTEESTSVVDYGSLWRFTVGRSQTLEAAGPLQAEYDVIVRIFQLAQLR